MAITEKTDENFQESIENGFYVVDLYGENCGPCRMLAPVIESVEAQMPFVDFIKVNTTKNAKTADAFQVDAVPTLLLIKDAQVLDRHLGYMDAEQLSDWIGQYLYC